MNRTIQSPAAAPAASSYAPAMEVPSGARTLHIAGQVGSRPDGTLTDDLGEQIELAWSNVFALLDAAGMAKTDLVDTLILLRSRDAVPLFREIRERVLDGHRPCATMLICEMANPDWQVEIAATAARAG